MNENLQQESITLSALSAISKYSRALDFKPILDSFFGKFSLIFTTGIASFARIG